MQPGGRVIVLQPNIRLVGNAYWDFIDHHVALTEKSLEEAAELAGLRTVEIIPRFMPYTTKSRLPTRAGARPRVPPLSTGVAPPREADALRRRAGMTSVAATQARTSAAWLRTHASEVILGALTVVAVVLLYRKGFGTTFYFDEWNFVMNRREWDVDTFLRAHNEHLVLLPVFLFKLLFVTVGLDSYGVYRALLLLVHVTCVVLVFMLVRQRTAPPFALASAALLLFLGSSWNNLLVPFQMAFLLSVAFGLGMLLALERRDLGGTIAVALLLAASLASSGVGIGFAAAAAVHVLVRSDRLQRVWAVAVPGALFLAWVLVYGDPTHTSGGFSHGARERQLPGCARLRRNRCGGSVRRRDRPRGRLGATAGRGGHSPARCAPCRPAGGDAPIARVLAAAAYVLGCRGGAPRPRQPAHRQSLPLPRRDLRAPDRRRAPSGDRGDAADSGRARGRGGGCSRRQLRVGAQRIPVSPGVVALRSAELGALEIAGATAPSTLAPDPVRAPDITAGRYFEAVRQYGSPASTPADSHTPARRSGRRLTRSCCRRFAPRSSLVATPALRRLPSRRRPMAVRRHVVCASGSCP